MKHSSLFCLGINEAADKDSFISLRPGHLAAGVRLWQVLDFETGGFALRVGYRSAETKKNQEERPHFFLTKSFRKFQGVGRLNVAWRNPQVPKFPVFLYTAESLRAPIEHIIINTAAANQNSPGSFFIWHTFGNFSRYFWELFPFFFLLVFVANNVLHYSFPVVHCFNWI